VEVFDAVQEAHLPQAFVPGVMTESAQILVVILRKDISDSGDLERQVGTAVAQLCSGQRGIDIWFIESDHSMLDAVRRTNCRIK
jgi:hypothetical protein